MLQNRIIPALQIQDGSVVKSIKFKNHLYVGDPVNTVNIFNNMEVDEILIIDIDTSNNIKYELIEEIATECFMPLTYGGGIDSVEIARKILKSGADKICINSHAFKDNKFITDCAKEFGSQAVIVSIDCKKKLDKNIVFIEGGKLDTGMDILEWIQKAEALGAGEILVNSIDNDGVGRGFDENLCKLSIEKTNIPVIICGGAGQAEHFYDIYKKFKPHAMSAANIFQFTENSYQNIKTELKKNKLNIR